MKTNGRLDPAVARQWRAWQQGPEDLRLRCDGTLRQMLAAELHQRWPLGRGLSRIRGLTRALLPQEADFVSKAGVRVRLKLGSEEFGYLSGRLPPEPLEISILSRMVRPGDVVVDVGAHRGLFILHLAGRPSRYHALEASSQRVAFLRRAFSQVPNLEIHPFAAGAEEGTALLSRAGDLEGRVQPLGSNEVHGAERIELRRLDTLLANERLDVPWVMKVDVEGNELDVLRGARGLIQRGLRPILLVELLGGASESQAFSEQVLDLLGENFEVSVVCHSCGVTHPLALPGQHEFFNLLFVPKELQERHQQLWV